MAMGVKQPIGQKRLTNIAVVRFKKGGKRFEIACYKNKVQNWRSNVEKDLDEVLQTTAIFTNVSKGLLAKSEELMEVFGTTDERAICLIILDKGELQVSDKERRVELDTLFKDVASVLVEKCVNPQSRRPYTMGVIERALKEVHFAVDPKRSAKAQALEVLPKLQERFPIERAMMCVRVSVLASHQAQITGQIREWGGHVDSRDMEGDSIVMTCRVDPGRFRELDHSITEQYGGRLDVLSVSAVGEGMGGEAEEELSRAMASAGLAGPSSSSTPQPSASASAILAGGFLVAGGVRAPMSDAAPHALRRTAAAAAATEGAGTGAGGAGYEVAAPRTSIASLPEEFASRRERFLELDTLQAGWEVELRKRGDGGILDAVFFSPEGLVCRSFAEARREALASKKRAGGD